MTLRDNFNRTFGLSRKAARFQFARLFCTPCNALAVVTVAHGRKSAPCPGCGKRVALTADNTFATLIEATKPQSPQPTSKKAE